MNFLDKQTCTKPCTYTISCLRLDNICPFEYSPLVIQKRTDSSCFLFPNGPALPGAARCAELEAELEARSAELRLERERAAADAQQAATDGVP